MNKNRVLKLLAIVIILIILYIKFTYVHFYDKEFARFVCEHMKYDSISMANIKENPQRGLIKKEEIENIDSIFIDLSEYRIEDLGDLKNFKSLKTLILSYIETKTDMNRTDIPTHLDAIQNLRYLEDLTLFNINIDDCFYADQDSITQLRVEKCVIEGESLITRFPRVKILTIDECNINSFDFIKEMNHLEWLQLSYNEYNCSLMPLMLATNLTKLDMFGNTSDDFKQLPLIPSVRELYFGGNIIPTREDAERYFKWDNLEELWLGGDKYDVATGTWITPKNE